MTKEQLDAIRARVEWVATTWDDARALLAEVERLTAERDTHAAEAERQMEYGVKQHEVAQAAMRGQASAFNRGAEAMREVVIKSVTCHFPTINAGGNCGLCTFCDAALDKHIRALPAPEDKS